MKTPFLICGLIVVVGLNAAVAQPKSSKGPSAEQRQKKRQKAKERAVDKLLKEYDKNEDEVLDETELPGALNGYLATLDADENGTLSRSELLKMRGQPGSKVGEIITGPAKGERYDDTLEVSEPAPDFTLADPTGKREVTLSSFREKRPVVLIFGSYT